MAISVMWFRRDLRLADNPALVDAAAAGDSVLPLFVLDPALWEPAGATRRSYLVASLQSLQRDIGGLVVRFGDPADVLPPLVAETGATSVHVAADFGPYGASRDATVEARLSEHGVPLVRTGSSYAVSPGRLRTGQGTAFQVFTPFAKAWNAHGWRAPASPPRDATWMLSLESDALPDAEPPPGQRIPEAGEAVATRRWKHFLRTGLVAYGHRRDRPDLDATSRMSVHLKWGETHPRTLLADLAAVAAVAAVATDAADAADAADAKSISRFRTELAWREFYADVLFHRPDSARDYYRPELAALPYDEPGDRFAAWCEGRTGFPIVDAGMRQLRTEGWMHNRVRMIVASFLVKDLHIEWQHGARHFMRWLVDADLPSNQHGWQWTAGSGTDPAPYFRVFNPIDQGKKFDPDGTYIRRYVPELRDVPTPDIHAPRDPIVDHATERKRALAGYESLPKRSR